MLHLQMSAHRSERLLYRVRMKLRPRPPRKGENGRPCNSKRPRQIVLIFRRLHPRQQCSSAVVIRTGRSPPLSNGGAPSSDSLAGQAISGLRPGNPADSEGPMPAVRHASFAPHVAADVRLLILGSLPGARPLAERRYYSHPTKQLSLLLVEFGRAHSALQLPVLISSSAFCL